MIQIFTGFAVIALAVFVGWVAGRTGVLGPGARHVLAQLNFNVLAPFLLFSVLATADVGALFSALLPVSALAAITMMLLFALVSLVVWRRGLARTMIGFVSVVRMITHAEVRPSTFAPRTASATGANSSSCSSTTGAEYAASPSM